MVVGADRRPAGGRRPAMPPRLVPGILPARRRRRAYHRDVSDESLRRDLESTLSVRRELGPEYEPALIDGFLDRVDARIAARVDALLNDRLPSFREPESRAGPGDDHSQPDHAFVLSLASLGMGIPISAISADQAGPIGLLVAWCGIAAVNGAYAWGRAAAKRPRRPPAR